MMFTNNSTLAIIRAIVFKDVIAAIKNRMILTTIIAFSLGLAIYFIAPSLLGKDDAPGLVVVGSPTDPLVGEFSHDPSLRLILVQDQSEMVRVLGDSDAPLLGIASASNINASVSDKAIVVEAYMDHWVNDEQFATTKQFFETRLSDWVGQSVSLNIHHDTVYTQLTGEHPFNFTFPMIGLLLFIGISVGPNLILEEKEAKTLEMLLVSPASIGQIIAGKAVVAMFYGIGAALVLFTLKNALVTHWSVAFLAAFCGSLFTSSIGLLMGMAIENRQQLIIWSQVVLISLLLPIFLHAILQATPIGNALSFIPTVALGKIVRVALSNDASIGIFIVELGWLLIVTGLLLLAVRWTIRRSRIAS